MDEKEELPLVEAKLNRILGVDVTRYTHTYPNTGDENQESIYQSFIELEKAGKVKRIVDEPKHVCFEKIAE